MNNAQRIFNLIRLRGSKEYQDQVPALADKDPIGNVTGVILSQPMVFKEFTNLLGAFIEMKVLSRVWNNPLLDLIRVRQEPYGEYSVEVTENPVSPQLYDPYHPEKLLQYRINPDMVAYFARNVKEKFKLTISYEDMKGAFQSYDKFNEYISNKLSMLESGKQISTYNHIMEAICSNYMSNFFVKSSVTLDTLNHAKEWTKEVMNFLDNAQYPNYDFNKYADLPGASGKFRGWVNPDDVVIIAKSSWINANNVEFLANAFQLDKAEIKNKIIKVPKFAYDLYDDDGVLLNTIETDLACLCADRRMFNFSSDLEIDDSFYNPETLTRNYYKHYWGTYLISPFGCALAFSESADNQLSLSINNYKVDSKNPSDIVLTNNTDEDISNVNVSVSIESVHTGDGADITEEVLGESVTLPESSQEITDVNAALQVLALELAKNVSVTIGGTSAKLSTSPSKENATVTKSLESKIARDNATNYLKAGEYTSPDSSEVKFTISDETVKKIISAYGRDIYIDVNFNSEIRESGNPPTNVFDEKIFIGLRNSAISQICD